MRVDDIKRVVELPKLLEAHLHWKQLVRDRGGDLKETKCSVYAPGFSTDELLRAGVPHSMVVRGQDGLRNLGGVIGDLTFKHAYVVNKFDVAILLVDRAMGLNNLQERSRVIFGALAAQLFFLAGVVPLQEYPEQILRWDIKLREALQSVIPNFLITEAVWSLALLPTELGGLGIRCLVTTLTPTSSPRTWSAQPS